MKKTMILFGVLAVVLLGGIFSFKNTPYSSEEKPELLENYFDYEQMWERLSIYKKGSSYTALPHEYTSDLYTTYYSMKLCDAMGIPLEVNEDLQYLVDSCTSIVDLYLLIDMLSSQQMELDWEEALLKEIECYREGDFYKIYKDSEKIDSSTKLFALFYAVRCYESLSREDELSEEVKLWLLEYQDAILNESPSDSSDFMNELYQIMVIKSYMRTPSDDLNVTLDVHIDSFGNRIKSALQEGSAESIFDLEAYWYLLGKGVYQDALEGQDFDSVLKHMRCSDGGFSLEGGEYSNPQIMYYVFMIADRYKIDFIYEQYQELVLRHRLESGLFIPYVLDVDDKATYYAHKISQLLCYEEEIKLPTDNANFYSIAMNKSTLSEDEFIRNYINSIYQRGSLTDNDIAVFAEILSIRDYIRSNAKIKNMLNAYITDLCSNVELLKSHVSQRIRLSNALYVYCSFWGSRDFDVEIADVLSLCPSSLSELYSFTRLMLCYYGEEGVAQLTDQQYDACVKIIMDAYDEESCLFYYSKEDTQTNMSTVFWGVYLSQIYFM